MPKKKTGKKSALQIKREKYYPKLKQLIESVGEWNINYLDLQREWGVPDSTLHNWKDKIQRELGPVDVTKTGREICKAAESNVKLLQKLLLKADGTKIKIDVIRAMNDTSKSLTDFLEAYKYKNKVADMVQHSGSVDSKLNESEMEKLKNFMKRK